MHTSEGPLGMKKSGQQTCGRYFRVESSATNMSTTIYLQDLDISALDHRNISDSTVSKHVEECMGRKEGEVTYKVVV